MVDKHSREVEDGQVGELLVGGPGLALGYHRRPELTAERFCEDPTTPGRGSRVYRTGDLVRRVPTGELEFIGRADDQLNVRGYRVEPGDVEAALLTHPAVHQAVVILQPPPRQRLVACLVGPTEQAPSYGELRRHVEGMMPEYMIPAACVWVTELPLGSNGKFDRVAVQAMVAAVTNDPNPTASSVVEDLITGEVAPLVARSLVSPSEDFFELGLDSLGAVQLLEEIRVLFGVELSMDELIGNATAADLSKLLERHGAEPPDVRIACLRAGGARAPLFCIHGWPRDLVRYRSLLPFLPWDQPVYGMVAQRVRPGESLLLTVEEMAALALEGLMKVQPCGPVHLLGHSFGGLVAFQAARMLSARDREVGTLMLLDTTSPGVPSQPRPRSPRRASRLRIWAAYERRFHRMRLEARISPGRTNPLTGINLANYLAERRYRPQPWPGRALILTTARATPAGEDSLSGWTRLLPRLEVHPVAGDHFSMLQEPHVTAVAQILVQALDASEPATGS